MGNKTALSACLLFYERQLYEVEITKAFLKRKYYAQRPSKLEPEASNAVDPGKSATGSGQSEARRAEAERTAEVGSVPVMQLQKPGTFAGLLFAECSGGATPKGSKCTARQLP